MSTNTLFWGRTKQVSFRVDGFSKGWAGLSVAGSRHSSILNKSPTADVSAAAAASAVAVLHARDAALAVLLAWADVKASAHAAAAGTVAVLVRLLIKTFAFRLFPWSCHGWDPTLSPSLSP